MDIKEYIASGILERYAMGDANADERRDVEQMAGQYPDVNAELESIQNALEQYAMMHAIQPPTHLKNKIRQQIQPVGTSKAPTTVSENVSRKDNVIPIRRNNLLAVAASLALLVSLAVNFYLYNRWHDTNSKLASLQSEKNELAKEFDVKRVGFDRMQQDLALISKPTVKPIALRGTPTNPDALATVYWDKSNNAVYLLVNHLPQTPDDKQYQLWAIVDGKPVDAGVFTAENDSVALHQMKNFSDAQAFAVTVERLGGSPTPTLSTMIVVGNI